MTTKSLNLRFKDLKETKRTYRFEEELAPGQLSPEVGTLYIPKTTLEKLGWNPGMEVLVTLQTEVTE